MNYYIADTHFGHDNIRRLSKRPFSSVKELDETIIQNWNSKITDNDDVYILGDFSFKGEDPSYYLSKLNGRKHLIVGNHDTRILQNHHCRKMFESIKDMMTITDNGQKIVLCHYPLVEWNGYYNGTLHFYGHVHNNLHNETTSYAANMKNAYNVGVDIIGFEPKTFKEIVG